MHAYFRLFFVLALLSGCGFLFDKGDDADSADVNTERINEEILRQLRALKYVE